MFRKKTREMEELVHFEQQKNRQGADAHSEMLEKIKFAQLEKRVYQ